jgi:hypothetical protein
VTTLRKLLDRHYMIRQHHFGDIVRMRAEALHTLNPTNDQVDLLVRHHHRHAVALGSHYYNLAATAHGFPHVHKFPPVHMNPRHVTNAIVQAQGDNIPGVIQGLVLSGAREVVMATSALDPNADGWDRIAEPGACQYCRIQQGPGGDSFPAHYNCECIAAPRFREKSNG